MTQGEIVKMIKQAVSEKHEKEFGTWLSWQEIEAFAKLVADKEREACFDAAMKAAEAGINTAIALEREACALLSEDLFSSDGSWIAQQIRARGEA